MKLPCVLQFRVLKEAIKAAFVGPYTQRFPFKPHTPEEGFKGKPEFREKDCMGCAACSQVCPPGAITFEDINDNGKAVRKLTLQHDMCIFCGQCQANCPTEKGVVLTKEFDLAVLKGRREVTSEVEKELIKCDCCDEIIAPRDQILWVAKKLGALAFSNASLMLFTLQHKSLSKQRDSKKPSENLLRADRLRVLCPRCRREAVVKS
ncbi:4Fe-4S dicluster domain-containing protein [Candidatus Omnitrophota bacterium]